MDTHTDAYVKLLLSPRQSRGITYWIYQGADMPISRSTRLNKDLRAMRPEHPAEVYLTTRQTVQSTLR